MNFSIQLDSLRLVDSFRAVVDTVFVNSVQPLPVQPVFDSKSLITAFSAAVFTQLLIIGINAAKEKRDLNVKKNLILDDMREKRSSLVDLKTAYQELLDKFKNRDVDSHQYRAFTELNSDIFNAVDKPDLYKIFKKDIMKIVEIYNVIAYLKAHDIEFTYSRYLQQINTHTEAMKHEKNHDFWCETHVGFVERAIKNIGHHIAATNNAILLINKHVGPPAPEAEENVLQ